MANSQAKRVGLYLRVSTSDQTTENQRRELITVAERQGWSVAHIFEDTGISGAKGRDKRPAFDALCKAVTRREIDMVASWSVDRLGRSLPGLIEFLELMRDKTCDLYLHQQGLDTSTSAGRAMFGMLSVFGEFERAMTVERVRAGMARAKANGVTFGRKPIEDSLRQQILERTANGETPYAIAKMLGCDRKTASKYARAP